MRSELGARLQLVVVTTVVVSAFWVILGGWLYHQHLSARRSEGEAGRAVTARNDAVAPPRRSASKVFPDATGLASAPRPGSLLIPVAGVRADSLVDTFTQARAGGARPHDAIDIMAPRGTPVVAAAPGRVEKIFTSQDGGLTVYQRSRDGELVYYYAHLDAYAPGLAEGQELATGSPIGTVGITGNASPDGPHLHFEVMAKGRDRKWYQKSGSINPYPLLTGKPAVPETSVPPPPPRPEPSRSRLEALAPA